ncbi:hypothetical protein BOTBODRAFT_27491 [Botryobasidium botryosum FD-172 SS1]|uniref:Uncharacterized protein n=1 Tax=Botryobasidium botryosum (strain FD-172 SS1) TaxID=930990 RepID=A0A067MWS4_BOTB1|nr:hypothetical protein BOTBODRAFT_27491 [Botryobasidium botryosum FD-172 SS1]
MRWGWVLDKLSEQNLRLLATALGFCLVVSQSGRSVRYLPTSQRTNLRRKYTPHPGGSRIRAGEVTIFRFCPIL